MSTPLPPSVLAQSYPLWPCQSNYATLLQALAVQGKRIVDVGCGEGRLLRSLVGEHGAAHGIGLECSPRQLAKARALPPLAHVEIHDAVAQAMPVADSSADLVIFFNSLHHIPPQDMQQALKEAARVLCPGGLLYVCEPVAYGPFFDLCRAVDDETELRAAAQDALDHAQDAGLSPHNEYRYYQHLVMPSFEAFQDRIVSANVDREARFAENESALRDLFTHLGTPTEGGTGFDQPSLVRTFIRQSAKEA